MQQLKPFVVFKIKNRVICIRKDSTEKLWLQLSPTRSEPRCSLEFICWQAHGRDGLSPLQVPHSKAGRRGGGQSPGADLSVECIQQQQDGADANDASKDERVTPLPKVDPLYQAVDGGKAVGQGVHLAVNGLEHSSLRSHILFCCHSNAYCLFYQTIRVSKVVMFFQKQFSSPVVYSRPTFI